MATARSRTRFVTTHKLVPAVMLTNGLQQTTTPGTLSVFIVTFTEITVKLEEVVSDGSFHKEVNIEPAVLKIRIFERGRVSGTDDKSSFPDNSVSIRRQQRENRRGGQKAVKGGENSYQNADTSSQYDVPRNGIPHGYAVLKYEQSRPSELTCPTGDNEQDCYNIIEEDSDRDTLSQSNVYSYARNEGLNTSSSNNPEGNYDRTDTHGVVSDWQGKSSSAPPDDDYNHIVSTDRPRQKTGLAAGKMEPNYFLARGRDENDCDRKTT
ncbi:hypothetical protein C0Q70_05128 [Pomacea canaliculata]|uniref:Uncharacterized protein n=1 Tax=Pomacea canaliculata TaxID=400727 RepID=A0A2T7PKA1_POMCA|nr:hypothetical protein C0Q70_05128 [Pomacea canaliculata]